MDMTYVTDRLLRSDLERQIGDVRRQTGDLQAAHVRQLEALRWELWRLEMARDRIELRHWMFLVWLVVVAIMFVPL